MYIEKHITHKTSSETEMVSMYHAQLQSKVFVDLLQCMRERCVVVDDDPMVGEKIAETVMK